VVEPTKGKALSLNPTITHRKMETETKKKYSRTHGTIVIGALWTIENYEELFNYINSKMGENMAYSLNCT
jgi:hypothetical protein